MSGPILVYHHSISLETLMKDGNFGIVISYYNLCQFLPSLVISSMYIPLFLTDDQKAEFRGGGGFFPLRKYALGVFKIDKQFLYILQGGVDSNMRNNSTHKLYHKLLIWILCKHYNKVIYPVVDYYYIKYVFWVWAKSIIPNNFQDFF